MFLSEASLSILPKLTLPRWIREAPMTGAVLVRTEAAQPRCFWGLVTEPSPKVLVQELFGEVCRSLQFLLQRNHPHPPRTRSELAELSWTGKGYERIRTCRELGAAGLLRKPFWLSALGCTSFIWNTWLPLGCLTLAWHRWRCETPSKYATIWHPWCMYKPSFQPNIAQGTRHSKAFDALNEYIEYIHNTLYYMHIHIICTYDMIFNSQTPWHPGQRDIFDEGLKNIAFELLGGLQFIYLDVWDKICSVKKRLKRYQGWFGFFLDVI